MTYFISGHRDLTWEEFTKWYAPAISKVICTDKEARFVVGDCEGADRMAQDKRYNDWIKEHPQRIAWSACNIDPRAVERLNRLTDATGAKIVVSSTWRSDSNLQEVFNLVGIKEPIHDITPYMRSRHRGSEIQEWLDKQTEPYRYVIFDDDTDMLDSQLPYFIQSDWLKWGLSDEDVEQAIHISK